MPCDGAGAAEAGDRVAVSAAGGEEVDGRVGR